MVAVNDLAPLSTVAHLLRYDSTYGPWTAAIEADEDAPERQRAPHPGLREAQPEDLDWDDVGVDVVVEATGRFRTRERAGAHIARGARKVVLTAPGTDLDATIVLGVNDDATSRAGTT